MTESVILPIELTNDNDGRGHKWFNSARRRNEIEALLRASGLVRTPFDHPVQLVVTRILGKGQRFWDFSSGLRGNWKEIEDALVACGWFHDDSAKWITQVDFRQDASRRGDGPSVQMTVRRKEPKLPEWKKVRDEPPPESVLVMAELGLEHVIGKRVGDEFAISNWTAKLREVGYWMPLAAIPEPYDA